MSPLRVAGGSWSYHRKQKKTYRTYSIWYPHEVKILGFITSRCSENEPALPPYPMAPNIL